MKQFTKFLCKFIKSQGNSVSNIPYGYHKSQSCLIFKLTFLYRESKSKLISRFIQISRSSSSHMSRSSSFWILKVLTFPSFWVLEFSRSFKFPMSLSSQSSRIHKYPSSEFLQISWKVSNIRVLQLTLMSQMFKSYSFFKGLNYSSSWSSFKRSQVSKSFRPFIVH